MNLATQLPQDDIDLSQVAKGFDDEARAAGVPMLISTGTLTQATAHLPLVSTLIYPNRL